MDMSGVSPPTEFLSRHSSDGTITFVDPRCISVIGYQPQVGALGADAICSPRLLVALVGDAAPHRLQGAKRGMNAVLTCEL